MLYEVITEAVHPLAAAGRAAAGPRLLPPSEREEPVPGQTDPVLAIAEVAAHEVLAEAVVAGGHRRVGGEHARAAHRLQGFGERTGLVDGSAGVGELPLEQRQDGERRVALVQVVAVAA